MHCISCELNFQHHAGITFQIINSLCRTEESVTLQMKGTHGIEQTKVKPEATITMKRSPATTTATSAIANVHLLQYYFKCVKVIGPLLYLLMIINNFVTVRYQIDLESAAILEVGGSQSILKLKGKDGSTNSRTLLEDVNVASGPSSDHMHSSRDLNTNTSSDDISICWLMSYPNSGTSFTMGLAQIDSNRTAAVSTVYQTMDIAMSIVFPFNSHILPE